MFSCKFREVSKNLFFTEQKLIPLTKVNLNKLGLTWVYMGKKFYFRRLCSNV